MRGQCGNLAGAASSHTALSRMARVFCLSGVVLLAGCVQPGGSGTSAPAAFDGTPDPYHYHCDEACLNGID